MKRLKRILSYIFGADKAQYMNIKSDYIRYN